MRVLILSCSSGGGHNATARALLELFEAHGDSCCMVDCLSYISQDAPGALQKSFSFVYRYVPKLFASGYRHTKRHPETFDERHNSRRMLNLGRPKLVRQIRSGRFDAVICTHVFAALMLTDACHKDGVSVRTGIVETDYTCTPGARSCDVNWHFIPSPQLAGELETLGVNREKIIPTGIPLRSAFYAPRDREGARRALDIPPDARMALIMGGSMGAGPVPALVAALNAQMDRDCVAWVVCGTNQSLRRSLETEYGDDPRIRILGFTDDVPRLMDAADVLVTKPGGISVTEAAMKRLPMVLVDSVSGCEAYNLDFFLKNGGAVTADTPAAQARLALSVLSETAMRDDMVRALDEVARGNQREIIWKMMNGDAEL